MTDEEVIDRILFRLYEVDPGALYVADFCMDDLRLDYPTCQGYVNRLVHEGLVRPLGSAQFMILTQKGKEVVKEGYRVFRQKEETPAQVEKMLRELSVRQLKGHIFQLRYWWAFVLINALMALLIAWSLYFLMR